MNISKSKIKSLKTCPLLFRWQYVDHRIPDIPPAAVTKIGIDVHDIFEKFYSAIKLEDIPKNNPYEYFKTSLDVIPQYKGIFNLFCMFQNRRWELTKNKDEFMPLFTEKNIIVSDESGIVDAIHIDGGEYTVLDYKSSASNPTELRFELNYYAKLINDSKILDKPVKYISSYGYKTGDFFYEEISDRSYNTMLKKVAEFRETMKSFDTMEFQRTPGWQCDWCQYKLSCNKL